MRMAGELAMASKRRAGGSDRLLPIAGVAGNASVAS